MDRLSELVKQEEETKAKRKELLDDIDVRIYGDLNHRDGANAEYRFAISAIIGYLLDKKFIETKEIYTVHFELQELLDPTKMLRGLNVEETFLEMQD